MFVLRKFEAIPMRVMSAAIDATAKSFAKSLLMQFLSFEA